MRAQKHHFMMAMPTTAKFRRGQVASRSMAHHRFRDGAFSILSVATATAAQGDGLSEYQVKAAFLFNFAKFIDWPAGSVS